MTPLARSICDICGAARATFTAWYVVTRVGPRKGNRVRWHTCDRCRDFDDRRGGERPVYEAVRR